MRNLEVKWTVAVIKAKSAVKDFFTKENGEVNIITIVVLIGIAILLAGVFKDQIKEILDNLLGQVGNSADSAVSEGFD